MSLNRENESREKVRMMRLSNEVAPRFRRWHSYSLSVLSVFGLLLGVFVTSAEADHPVEVHCLVQAIPDVVLASEADSQEEAEDAESSGPEDAVLEAIDPVPAGNEGVCFPTEALADAAVAKTQSIIAMHYDKVNYEGSSLRILANDPAGCTTGKSWSVSAFSTVWNNDIASTENFAGCDIVNHFDYKFFKGAKVDCSPCATLGALNNQTSSAKYKP